MIHSKEHIFLDERLWLNKNASSFTWEEFSQPSIFYQQCTQLCILQSDFFSASNKTTLIPCLLIVLVNNIEGGSCKIQPHIFSPTFDFCTFILLFEASLNQSPLLISGALAVAVQIMFPLSSLKFLSQTMGHMPSFVTRWTK